MLAPLMHVSSFETLMLLDDVHWSETEYFHVRTAIEAIPDNKPVASRSYLNPSA
jgi:hypothetical protein